MAKLTDRFVKSVSKPGRYTDTGYRHGLILNVHRSKHGITRSWVQHIVIAGRRTHIGLGAYPIVTLAEARQAAIDNLRSVRKGVDPRFTVPTFRQAVEQTIALRMPTWKDAEGTAGKWRSVLSQYAYPKLGAMPVDKITGADIMAVLSPHWSEKHSTLDKVRRYISTVMKLAIAQGHRDDNPAGDTLLSALPKNGNKRNNFKALPYEQVGNALEIIRQSRAFWSTKLAFEFLALAAGRSGEVRGMVWDEVDLDARTWTIPQSRMKKGREHRVPLSTRAIEILQESIQYTGGNGLVFPSIRGKVLNDNTLSKICRDHSLGFVPHGLRASFKMWAVEKTNHPNELSEHALAHVVGDAAQRSYQRSDLFQKRMMMMQSWADYLSGTQAKVVNLR